MKKTILIGLTFVAGIIGIAAVYQRGHHISDELTDPVAGTLPNKAWSQRMTGIMLVRAQNPGEKNAYLDEDKYNKLTSYLGTVWLDQSVNGERCWRASFKFDGQYYLTLAGHGGGHEVYHNLVFFSSRQPPPEVAQAEAQHSTEQQHKSSPTTGGYFTTHSDDPRVTGPAAAFYARNPNLTVRWDWPDKRDPDAPVTADEQCDIDLANAASDAYEAMYGKIGFNMNENPELVEKYNNDPEFQAKLNAQIDGLADYVTGFKKAYERLQKQKAQKSAKEPVTFPTPVPQPTTTATHIPKDHHIVARGQGWVIMRQLPDINAPEELEMGNGADVTVVGQVGDWYLVQVGDIKGYMHGNNLYDKSTKATLNPTK